MSKAPEHRTPSVSQETFEIVLQRVRLYARRRVAWLRHVWTEAGNPNSNGHTVHVEIDGYLRSMDVPAAERDWYAAEHSVQTLNTSIAQIETALRQDQDSRLAQLIQTFSLNDAETDVLHACFASALEPGINRVYAYLHDHSGRGYASEALVARLFGHGYCLPLGPESPLKIWDLVAEHDAGRGEPARYELSPYIRNWLLGMDAPDEALTGIAHVQPVHSPLANWPVSGATDWIKKMLDHPAPPRLRLFIAGAEGSGRRTFAACVAQHLGLPLLAVNSDLFPETRWAPCYRSVQRYTLLNRCAVAWTGNAIKDRACPPQTPAFHLQFITGEVDEFIQPDERFLDQRIELPPLHAAQRRELWLRMVPSVVTWPAGDLDILVRRRQTNVGQINAAAALRVSNAAEAAEAIGAGARRRLGNLAQHLNSDFHKDDLVLPDELRRGLNDFTFEATERVSLWEQTETKRLFPQGQGLLALFTGPPGTGKTMAAQVIANELHLDLYRVDLSTIVSKYVGETSKNIERILARAQRMDAVLLFDEADALFGKRTEIKDAHDRFANTDTNYLLQAIEQYPGIVILASNRKANIDSGFMRRLRYVLEFPKPDMQQRLQLWQRIVRELAGPEKAQSLKKELIQLAGLQEITGAQIKYAVLTALYLARQAETSIGMPQLLRGLERELIKEGRGLGRQEYELLKKQP